MLHKAFIIEPCFDFDIVEKNTKKTFVQKRVSLTTLDRLKNFGRYGDTFDDVLNTIMDKIEKGV